MLRIEALISSKLIMYIESWVNTSNVLQSKHQSITSGILVTLETLGTNMDKPQEWFQLQSFETSF